MSSSVCGEQHHHKFHPSHQEVLISSPTKQKTHLHNIEIPPRKLLSRKIHIRQMSENHNESFLDSPKHSSSSSSPEEALFRKFLPRNTGYDDDDDDDPYSSDHFRMFEFKVRMCTRSRSHDWTDCPFAHSGEKARRRDPRKYCYSGTGCPDFRRGGCNRGESCEFAHGVFECWLHPNRYRTEACKDGKNCKRKVCFFAHTPRQLRLPPVSTSPDFKFKKSSSSNNNCCVYCHHSMTSSPTSTLMMGMSHSHHHLSPPLSPPISPVKRHSLNAFSPVSRFNDQFNGGGLGYEEALDELRSSIEVLNFADGCSPTRGGNSSFSWIDDSFSGDDLNQQFILSPPSSSVPTEHSFGGGACSSQGLIATSNSNANYSTSVYHHEKLNETNGWGTPDLGWVNELLM